jgi:hypothetical protein
MIGSVQYIGHTLWTPTLVFMTQSGLRNILAIFTRYNITVSTNVTTRYQPVILVPHS